MAACLVRLAPAQEQPDAWWRFEAGPPFVDSSPAASFPLDCEPLGHLDAPIFLGNASEGVVGRFLHVDGRDVNRSLCAETRSPLPAAQAAGLSVEFLFRLQGPENYSAFNKAGNTSIVKVATGRTAIC